MHVYLIRLQVPTARQVYSGHASVTRAKATEALLSTYRAVRVKVGSGQWLMIHYTERISSIDFPFLNTSEANFFDVPSEASTDVSQPTNR